MIPQSTHLIPIATAHRYTAAPAPTTVAAAKSLQETIRDVLGSDYVTFLQGSYKNDTGVPELNDVDVVALRRQTYSRVFTNLPPGEPVTWEAIFTDVQARLEASHHYRGKTERGDKCIKVNTLFKADVVPAVHLGDPATDPIAVFSCREATERRNYPRIHYQRGVEKSARTAGHYKPTVRMFKRWARNWFAGTNVAPSFYIECLIQALPDNQFTADPPSTFLLAGNHIVNKITASTTVLSVAGDKDILVGEEWRLESFREFRDRLSRSLLAADFAYHSPSATNAERLWREAFND